MADLWRGEWRFAASRRGQHDSLLALRAYRESSALGRALAAMRSGAPLSLAGGVETLSDLIFENACFQAGGKWNACA